MNTMRIARKHLSAGLLFIVSSVAHGQSATPADAKQVDSIHVSPHHFTSFERVLLESHGDRLTVAGKERSTWTGQFTRIGGRPVNVTITRELPDKIRVDSASQTRNTLVSNGATAPPSANLTEDDKDLLESMYLDTADHFFLGKTQGVSYRLLASHVRADDGSAGNYSGPWYNIYQLTTPLTIRNESTPRFKAFTFDTSNGLLAAVHYQIKRDAGIAEVMVEYTGWKTIEGQAVPSLVRRLENGAEVWRFDVTSATFAPLAADNWFNLP